MSFPFHIYDKAQSIAEIIRNSGFQDTVWVRDVLPLMSTDDRFYPENKNEYLIEDYIDFDRYGRDLMDEDGAVETEYGYIYSEDGFELDETPTMQM